MEVRAVDLVEAPEQVLGRLVGIVAARVVLEVVAQWRPAELLLENVDFVEKQDDAGAHKPPRVDDRVKEQQTLHHAVLAALFQEHLVILAQGNAKYDRGHIFEAVNPLLTLTPLASHVEHVNTELAHLEAGFIDTRRLCSGAENIHLVGNVVGVDDPLGLLKEAGSLALAITQTQVAPV